MLGASEDTERDVVHLQNDRDIFDHQIDRLVSFRFLGFDKLCDLMVFFIVQEVERKIFEFILDLSDT